jgi:hypothetical protein
MQNTKALLLVLVASGAGALACFFGIYQVSHGQALPVASTNSIFTLPLVAAILACLAYPIYRYRKQLINYAKANAHLANGTGSGKGNSVPSVTSVPAAAVGKRPNPLNPFYAVRVLLLAKSVAVASAVLAGWHAGLVALQLSTPVVTNTIWNNVLAFVGAILAMALALAVERICRLPNAGKGDSPASSEVTPA